MLLMTLQVGPVWRLIGPDMVRVAAERGAAAVRARKLPTVAQGERNFFDLSFPRRGRRRPRRRGARYFGGAAAPEKQRLRRSSIPGLIIDPDSTSGRQPRRAASAASAAMPFDLPPKVAAKRSPFSPASWQRALNYRDFQDKLLRAVQYSSRGVAFFLLRADPAHALGAKLFNL